MRASATTGEWLETDGLGGYAMGAADGLRRRRYHGLLVTAVEPPTRRVCLVAGLDTWVEVGGRPLHLTPHRYRQGVVPPEATGLLAAFGADPWPRWTYRLPDGTLLVHDLFITHGMPRVALSWRLAGTVRPLTLCVRPLLAYRGHHQLGRERPLRLEGEQHGERVVFRPDPALPPLAVASNGAFVAEPTWYRGFLYEEEEARGYDHVEDLASPGYFRFELLGSKAALVLTTDERSLDGPVPAAGLLAELELSEGQRRNRSRGPRQRAVDAYLVRRGAGSSVVAGYPWFGDWGRDTFIALRGLCLATERHDEARRVLLAWAATVDRGMVPCHFADDGSVSFGSVDASLWFVVAAGALLERARLPGVERRRLLEAIETILDGYAHGTRHGIRADADGLLSSGEPGSALTWMDAKQGDWVVTPRIGKPVEVQALWANALAVGAHFAPRFEERLARVRAGFERRFWLERGGYLYDVIDVDHEPGRVDASFRPNQLFAVGGLPLALLAGPRARHLVELAFAKLWTPAGPRSLAPGEPGYRPHYAGDVRRRDEAYHQGTVWPWLAGAFVEAWVRVHGGTREVRQEAQARFLAPLLAALDPRDTGHLPEIADAEAPHTPRGCPFQAWSLGEVLRLELEVLAAGH